MIRVLFAVAMMFMMPVAAFAAEKVLLEEVVVTASRVEERENETTSQVVVIRAKEIERMNVAFVPDVLRKVSELNLVQNGGPGKQATVMLRGASGNQTMVMIDGVKVKSTTTGQFDFSWLMVDDIERIEIVKGPQSTLYGSEAMGGVINIVTKKGMEEKPTFTLSYETGSYETHKPSISVSGKSGRYDYRLSAAHVKSEGFSVSSAGTEKDAYENKTLSGKFGVSLDSGGRLEFSALHSEDESELDGYTTDDPDYVQEGTRSVYSLRATLPVTSMYEQAFVFSETRDDVVGTDPTTPWNNSEINTLMRTAEAQGNLYISDTATAILGLEYREESGENKGMFDESVENIAAFVNIKESVKDWTFSAGARHDDHETAGGKTTYRVAVLYGEKEGTMRYRASYSTGFRAPTINDLYYIYNSPWFNADGNLDLKPEESSSWELGLEKDLGERGTFAVTYFEQDYANLIEWVYVTPSYMQARNVAEAEVKGLELSFKYKATDKVGLSVGYTHLDTEDKSTGEDLNRRPDDKYTAGVEYTGEKGSVSANYVHVGQRRDGALEMESYGLMSLAASYKAGQRTNLFARVENVFDEDYEEASGYNTPGRSYYAGVRTSF